MERCVYYSDLPSIVKLPQAEMAEVALALSQKSCAGIDSGMSNMTCEEEDVLCHLAKNMSTMQTDMFSMWDNLPAEADSCKIDYAVGCIGSYTMRLLTSAFAPKNDYDDICWGVKRTVDCVKQHAYNCTGSKFNDVIESLYILGNGTHDSCPGMSSYICPVTAMKPKQVGAECQLSKMQSCVSSFYNETYNKTMTEPDYCMKLENYISCVEMNSSNCHPMVVEEIYELMAPGVLHANYNCSILTQKVMEATSCRTPGKCPLLQLQIAAYEKAMEIQSRGGNCV
ncbi:hypothetical protein FSP39_025455 [Pinctada imbricata]|uniref:Uncharacterized protein n=1 Tax=Pinctada imbricata TaxID=66713 RepID=A0AA88Y6M1_PINIB|nr:hypothetical protein FSP39_025455 [Pinctada imbricata]